ncbi:MAG: type IV toxin-antitoxin system AbiEi family antitoxin domain-containing protein [Bacteroidales bacterium]|nr:type IV toxin-antitoxin system AbiEi family antitoxin domain-containing protein [Bacteroidales bacterium]MDT8431373.1 type IV toxin-antitoxin system AbiEi family antitoxin domain-containing protein [Bacteroidales bacterium]
MSTYTSSKINLLLQKLPSGALFFSSWMKENGISYELQRRYRDSAWLKPFGTGVMIRAGECPTIYGALSSLNKQTDKHFYVGGLSALELAGYSHTIPMGRQVIYVGYPKNEWVPSWLKNHDWGVDLLFVNSKYFDSNTAITSIFQGAFEILTSTPERAYLECLNLVPKHYNLMDLYYVMEQLTVLRPSMVQILLEKNTSVKIKRLFMYMAEKAGHAWFRELDLTKIDTGSGKREIVANGVYDSKYQIIIPEELKNYE